MKVKLVIGVAGSGKTTYCKKQSQFLIHDDWVNDQYIKNHDLNRIVVDMFHPHIQPEFSKSDLVAALKKDNTYNVFLKNYFQVLYAVVIKTYLDRTDSTVPMYIECPYLDENIEALKKLYPKDLEIVWVDTTKEIIFQRLKERGWNQARIQLSLFDQLQDLEDFQELIDTTINGY